MMGTGAQGRLFGEVGLGGARERRRREMRDARIRDLGRGETISGTRNTTSAYDVPSRLLQFVNNFFITISDKDNSLFPCIQQTSYFQPRASFTTSKLQRIPN